MADINLQMTQRNAANTAWDNLYPKTRATNVEMDYKTYKTLKDANGVFTTVEYKRADNTLAIKSVLSGGTSPKYTTRTLTYYASNGTTVEKTVTRTLSYDADGVLTSEV
jgi:hypothetical protein